MIKENKDKITTKQDTSQKTKELYYIVNKDKNKITELRTIL
jgi:hypothetical protein